MPTKSSLTSEDKSKVVSAIPSLNKIFVAVPTRLYFAHPDPHRWSYGGLQGALAFTHDKSKGTFIFKLVDLEGTRGVIWQQELRDETEYRKDLAFFHYFAGDKYMIGIEFAEEKDATLFHAKVTNRKSDRATKAVLEPTKIKKSEMAHRSMISGSRDDSWLALVQSLEARGISAEVIENNKDFIKDFVRLAQKPMDVSDPVPKKPLRPSVPQGDAHGVLSSVAFVNGDSTPIPPRAPPSRSSRLAANLVPSTCPERLDTASPSHHGSTNSRPMPPSPPLICRTILPPAVSPSFSSISSGCYATASPASFSRRSPSATAAWSGFGHASWAW